MAHKKRFNLKMKNGAVVNTLPELQEHYDVESVLTYFANGQLKTWLSDRYYSDIADTIGALSENMPDLESRIYKILCGDTQHTSDMNDIPEQSGEPSILAPIDQLSADEPENDADTAVESVENDEKTSIEPDTAIEAESEAADIMDTPQSSMPTILPPSKAVEPLPTKQASSEKLLNSMKTIDNSYIEENKSKENICELKSIGEKPEESLELNQSQQSEMPTAPLEAQQTDTISTCETDEAEIPSEQKEPSLYACEGEKLFLEDKYREAFPLIQKETENGNPRAMYLMGRYLHDGYEMIQIDNEKRIQLCKNAKLYDDPLLLYGYIIWCIDPTSEEAAEIITKIKPEIEQLAERGNSEALCALGYLFVCGNGISPDLEKSRHCYEKAAEQGHAFALLSMSGLSQDDSQTLKFIQQAAELGSAKAQCMLGELFYKNTGDLRDPVKAVEWFKRAALQGNDRAQTLLGIRYFNGDGTDQNYRKAMEWFVKAANQKNAIAENFLGIIYQNGKGVTADTATAVKWFRKAAQHGNNAAINMLNSLGYSIDGPADMGNNNTMPMIDAATIAAHKAQKAAQSETEHYKCMAEILDSFIHRIAKDQNTAKPYDSKEVLTVPQKVTNAINKYAFRATGRVIGMVDTSLLFISGKKGILFTTDGFAFDYLNEKVFVRYDEIQTIELSENQKKVIISGFFKGINNPAYRKLEIDNLYFNVVELKGAIEQLMRYA